MRTLLAPGMAFARSLSLHVALWSIALLFFAAQVLSILAVETVLAPSSLLITGIAALFALATYLLAAFASCSRIGLDRLSQAAERIASGDLTAGRASALAVERSEAGRAWRSIGQMTASLTEIVEQVRGSAESIARGSREIAAGYTNLSQRTEEQASTLEETASGMEEISGTVKQNAANSRVASSVAEETLSTARNGAEAVHGAVSTMEAIHDGSKKIAEIVGIIDGFALQTNILALNAAVEAARAGEQGKGFAVVASEVRSLAQGSAQAAREIKTLIQTSMAQISEGEQQAAAVGRLIDQMLAKVEHVNRLIGEIATASAEQNTGVQEINKAIMQMESVTQQNAALVEQAGAAALSFDEEAARLVEVVGRFKIDRMEARDQAVALVKRAVAHMQTVGADRACDDFDDRNGPYVFDDFYVFVVDMQGVRRAYGNDPSKRGENVYELKDADGKYFIQEFIRVARTQGRGWSDYRWANPVSGRVEAKSSYIEQVGELIVACGVYREESRAQAHVPAVFVRGPFNTGRRAAPSPRLPSRKRGRSSGAT